MKKILIFSLVLMTFFLLTACAHYSLVEGGKTVVVGEGFRTTPQRAWSMGEEEGAIFWTADGPGLQRLIFFPAVGDGKPLYGAMGDKAGTVPLFYATMTPLEIMDLVEATLVRRGVHQLEKQNLRPATMCNRDGFRFDFSFAAKSGLRYRGFATGTVKDRKLYLILYTGTELHYYDLYLREAESMAASTQIL